MNNVAWHNRVGPTGLTTHTYAIVFAANQSRVIINLPQPLDHVVEVWLDEYAITRPNGGALTPAVWRLEIDDQNLKPLQISNAIGSGHVLAIDNVDCTHVVYNPSRLFSIDNKGRLTSLVCRLSAASGNVASDVAFDSAVFFLTMKTAPLKWTGVNTDKQLPLGYPSIPYAERLTF